MQRVLLTFPTDGDGSSPTRLGMRLAFWFSLLTLLFAVRRSFRPMAVMVLLGICAVPSLMVGYVRYVPWWLAPVLLLYVDSAGRRGRLRQGLAFLLVAGMFLLRPCTLLARLSHAAGLVDDRARLAALLEGGASLPPVRPCCSMSAGQLKLMQRQVPALGRAELLPFSEAVAAKVQREGLRLPGWLFVFDDMEEMRRHARAFPAGTVERVKHVLRVSATTVPKLIAGRVISAFGKQDRRNATDVQ